MPKTKKNLSSAGIKEFSGLSDRGYGSEGNWVESFKKDFEKGYRKFWAKRGINSSETFREINNSLFVK